jgi:uncharacterized OsmC-like protein
LAQWHIGEDFIRQQRGGLGHAACSATGAESALRENRSSIQGFYGAGVEDSSRSRPFLFTNGEPPVLLGNNEGANPVEYLLHALAGCLTTTTVLHATARGITIHSMSTELSGDIDVQGLLDLDARAPVGYQGITVNVRIEADCNDDELDALLAFSKDHSPVCSSVCRPVPITLHRVATRQQVA